MARSWGLCLCVIAFTAGTAAAQCSSVPSHFSQACNELEGHLSSFDATIHAQWNGDKPPVAFGAELTGADSNRGLQVLMNPSTINGVKLQLDGLSKIGVQSVVIGIGFPILYQPFYQYNNDPQDYATVLSFYQSVIAEVRRRGLKVIVETSVLFPNHATDLPLSAYYATLSSAQVTAGRAQVAQTIAQTLQPDWLNLGSEPDTQSALLGLPAPYTPQQYADEISTVLTQLRGAGISGRPLLGAGVGTWDSNGTQFVQALTALDLDFIDLHIYSANLSFLADTAALLDTVHAAGKGAAISEAWMRKLTDEQLQGKTDYGIESLLSSTNTTSMDTFSFWSPLDSQFLAELAELAYWKNLYYISPYPIEYFFAYLDYNQVSSLSAGQINAQEQTAATAALNQGAVTATGQAYAAAIATTMQAPAVTLSSTSLTFGDQAVGSASAAQTVTLANSGTAALAISSIAITGSNAGDFNQTNTCGAGLAVGADCSISVIFDPSAVGTRTASLGITDNAVGSPQTISLSGTGESAAGNGPVINANGVVNGADYAAQMAPGSIVSIFGTNLASSRATASTAPLPVNLGGATVTVTSAGGNVQAPLFFVSPLQIDFQLPWEVRGQVTVAVTFNQVTSEPAALAAPDDAPGIFALNSQGTGPGAILISNTPDLAQPSGSVAGRTSRPAKRGEFVSIYCTGLGPLAVTPPPDGALTPASPLFHIAAVASVSIGGVVVTPAFAGLASGFAGLYQVDAEVPAGVNSGDTVPVFLTVGGVKSNTVTIAVQ